MSSPDLAPPLGRRDRNMQDKRRRIVQAATRLFEDRGYDGVTTHEVSEKADIAVGTLFRYAASKSELLLLVYNDKLREALAQGTTRAVGADDPVEAIMEMVSPLLELGRISSDNGAAYQRELLFGAPTTPNRQEGLGVIADLEAAIASRLAGAARAHGLAEHAEAGRLAASTIFAATHLMIAMQYTGAHRGHAPETDLRGQITQVVRGYLATLRLEPAGPTSKALLEQA